MIPCSIKAKTDLTDKVHHTHKGQECVRDVDNQAFTADHHAQQITQYVTKYGNLY